MTYTMLLPITSTLNKTNCKCCMKLSILYKIDFLMQVAKDPHVPKSNVTKQKNQNRHWRWSWFLGKYTKHNKEPMDRIRHIVHKPWNTRLAAVGSQEPPKTRGNTQHNIFMLTYAARVFPPIPMYNLYNSSSLNTKPQRETYVHSNPCTCIFFFSIF